MCKSCLSADAPMTVVAWALRMGFWSDGEDNIDFKWFFIIESWTTAPSASHHVLYFYLCWALYFLSMLHEVFTAACRWFRWKKGEGWKWSLLRKLSINNIVSESHQLTWEQNEAFHGLHLCGISSMIVDGIFWSKHFSIEGFGAFF